MGKKVIVAGHICVDITPVFKGKKVARLDEILQPGKLIEVGEAQIATGGVVANTGLAMKILGADVSLMGKVGNDSFHGIISENLQKYGVKDELLVTEEESTSYSVVVAVPGIDRIFLHNPGANHIFYAEDIPENAIQEAALLHFGYPPLMKSMYQNDGKELEKLFLRVKAAGCATSLDLAAVDPSGDAGKADWTEILKKVVPLTDFFVPSVEELCFMLDRERLAAWEARAQGRDLTEVLDIENDVQPLADQCMEMGAKVLLIKCGAAGMYYRTAGREKLQKISRRLELDLDNWSDKEGFERSYVPEQVLSGTGAGDTSIAAFLTAVIKGYAIEDAMHMAAATGASCVVAYDALSGLKSFEEIKAKIDAGWEKR